MTYIETSSADRAPIVAGRAIDTVNGIFHHFLNRRPADHYEAKTGYSSTSQKPLRKRLSEIQEYLSEISMHLPSGFASGLNRQFANLMDEDAWEDDDSLIHKSSVTAFATLLVATGTRARPGIGTDGKGSVTAAWTNGEARLICECLPSGKVTCVVSRKSGDGEVERAAFSPMKPNRIAEVLAPFDPGTWFDN